MRLVHTFSLCILILILISAGCSKHSNSPVYYFSFNVGSQLYVMDSASASLVGPPMHGFAIHGFPDYNIHSTHDVACAWYGFNSSSTDTAVTGTYTCRQNSPVRTICSSSLAILTSGDVNSGQYLVTSNFPFAIVVTENTPQYIAGTFSGQMNGMTISNGRFRVPYRH